MDESNTYGWWQEWPPAPEPTQAPLSGAGMLEDPLEYQRAGNGNLLTGGMASLDLSGQAAGQIQPGQQVWPITGQQQQQGTSPDGHDINLESIGTHFTDNWHVDPHMAPGMASNLLEGLDALQPAPGDTWGPGLTASGLMPFPQDPTDLTWPAGFPPTGDFGPGYFDPPATYAPSSLALEPAYSSSGLYSTGSPSAPPGQLPSTSTSMGSADADAEGSTNASTSESSRGLSGPAPPAAPPSQAVSFPCHFPSCTNTYPRLCDLNKHEKKHTRPFHCPVPRCAETRSERKGLHRHLWTAHKAYAEQEGIPSELDVCPFPGCGMRARRDNLKRHIRVMRHG